MPIIITTLITTANANRRHTATISRPALPRSEFIALIEALWELENIADVDWSESEITIRLMPKGGRR